MNSAMYRTSRFVRVHYALAQVFRAVLYWPQIRDRETQGSGE